MVETQRKNTQTTAQEEERNKSTTEKRRGERENKKRMGGKTNKERKAREPKFSTALERILAAEQIIGLEILQPLGHPAGVECQNQTQAPAPSKTTFSEQI